MLLYVSGREESLIANRTRKPFLPDVNFAEMHPHFAENVKSFPANRTAVFRIVHVVLGAVVPLSLRVIRKGLVTVQTFQFLAHLVYLHLVTVPLVHGIEHFRTHVTLEARAVT